MLSKVYDEIIDPFQLLNGCTVGVWEFQYPTLYTYLCWDVGIKVSACKMAPADVPVITLDSPQSQEAAVICHPVMSRHYTDRDDPIKIAGQIVIDRTEVRGGLKHKSIQIDRMELYANLSHMLIINIIENVWGNKSHFPLTPH